MTNLRRMSTRQELVNKTSSAQLRGSSLEEDAEPWEKPPEEMKLNFDSAIMQKLYDAEEASRMDWNEEWYSMHRNLIGEPHPKGQEARQGSGRVCVGGVAAAT